MLKGRVTRWGRSCSNGSSFHSISRLSGCSNGSFGAMWGRQGEAEGGWVVKTLGGMEEVGQEVGTGRGTGRITRARARPGDARDVVGLWRVDVG